MKRVTAIVRPEKMEPLKDALFAADVKGMTISQVHGCGAQHGWSEYVRGTEVMLNMVPKVKFEVVVAPDRSMWSWTATPSRASSSPAAATAT